jgi:hypothetical protein
MGIKRKGINFAFPQAGRLVITENISEETYEQLRTEWKDKLRYAQENRRQLEHDISLYLDDLDAVPPLRTQMSRLFERSDDKAKTQSFAANVQSDHSRPGWADRRL